MEDDHPGSEKRKKERPTPSSSSTRLPASPLPSPPTVPDFTQDPLDVQPISCHSQIPTPEDSPPSQHVSVLPAIFATPEKESQVANPLAPERSEKNPRALKKSVSIVPHTPEKLDEKPRRMLPPDSDRRSAANSIVDYDEKTPLLAPSSSLPTVVGYDEAMSMISGYPGPSNHTRSEIGRDELRRKKRKRRIRRHTDRIMDEKHKARPFIASPFMPIPTKFTEPDRRSMSSVSRENRISGGYGSTSRQQEEGLLKRQTSSEHSSEEDEEEDEAEGEEECEESIITQKESLFDLSSKEWATIIMLALANLCSTVAFSCIAPFYPAEASIKGLTESQVGMVFGVFELTMFITAPVFGKYMVLIGSKKMFVLGLLMTGVTAILFGFLNYLPSGALFFWGSLLIRILEALGDAAFVTSSFAISAKCFPGRITVVVGILETFAGLGYTAGPLIGGFLYEFGGFQTPFLVLGAILLVATSLSIFLIENSEDEMKAEGQAGILAMLRIPVIWIMIYAIIVCAISLSFLDPTLSAHLASFNLSPTMVGLMFLLCGGIYTLSAPVWGLIIDRFHCSTSVMLFGSIATVVSMLLIGPAPFLPIEKNLPLIGVSLAILGVAAGAQYIPTFQGCLDAVKLAGFEDSFHTYGCVSGLFQSAFAFGAFFGPTVGGFAVEKIGFPLTTTLIGLIHVLFILTVILFHGSSCCLRRRH